MIPILYAGGMTRRNPLPAAIAALTLVSTAGCAAGRPSDGLVLTPEALGEIAAKCGAANPLLRPQLSGYPNVSFGFSDVAPAPDKPSPTVKCMGKRLKRYRYGYMMLDPTPLPPAPGPY